MTRPPAASLVDAVQRRRADPVALARESALRIAASSLNAVVDFDPDEGPRNAAIVARRLAAGERLPLAGLPILIKDNIWVAGRRVAQGSRLYADFVAPEDAIAVARLRHAGAVIMGMSNAPEFACKGQTNSPLHGATRHPLDPGLTPGGSSGGAAAAVAAGLVPVALGTDAGGSSRRPPAHCGVVGFKPSFGAVPYGPGFAEPFAGLSCHCPIATGVADAALLFEAMAGPDPRDPDTITIAPPDPRPVSSMTIAYSPRFGLDTPVDDDARTCVEAAVEALARAGATIVRADPVWPEGTTETALMPLQHAGLAAIHGDAFRADPSRFDPDVAAQIERGFGYSGTEVMAARLLSGEVARAVAAFFGEHDLLIGPTVPCAPWSIDRLGPETIGGVPVAPRAHAAFTPLFNHAMTPALSVPCGTNARGLPFGLQIVGPRGADRRVLAFAAFAEAAMA